ncbi:hypothetical protein B0T19DRAFT_289029 [Cercophora scortea]|uniref:Uncharacterized protein n=1 Tax=Cercophora scortea TaxID=314031 RepID=A0AAE0I2A6_9PEZI|nr:hypothetical protein B0T19DRAFT_289029 [Cercophora scortea]
MRLPVPDLAAIGRRDAKSDIKGFFDKLFAPVCKAFPKTLGCPAPVVKPTTPATPDPTPTPVPAPAPQTPAPTPAATVPVAAAPTPAPAAPPAVVPPAATKPANTPAAAQPTPAGNNGNGKGSGSGSGTGSDSTPPNADPQTPASSPQDTSGTNSGTGSTSGSGSGSTSGTQSGSTTNSGSGNSGTSGKSGSSNAGSTNGNAVNDADDDKGTDETASTDNQNNSKVAATPVLEDGGQASTNAGQQHATAIAKGASYSSGLPSLYQHQVQATATGAEAAQATGSSVSSGDGSTSGGSSGVGSGQGSGGTSTGNGSTGGSSNTGSSGGGGNTNTGTDTNTPDNNTASNPVPGIAGGIITIVILLLILLALLYRYRRTPRVQALLTKYTPFKISPYTPTEKKRSSMGKGLLLFDRDHEPSDSHSLYTENEKRNTLTNYGTLSVTHPTPTASRPGQLPAIDTDLALSQTRMNGTPTTATAINSPGPYASFYPRSPSPTMQMISPRTSQGSFSGMSIASSASISSQGSLGGVSIASSAVFSPSLISWPMPPSTAASSLKSPPTTSHGPAEVPVVPVVPVVVPLPGKRYSVMPPMHKQPPLNMPVPMGRQVGNGGRPAGWA